MRLDATTLSVVTVFITAVLGALLVFAGIQNRSIRAPLWWGTALLAGTVGLALVTSRGHLPDALTIQLGNAFILLGYGLTWSGARHFEGRRVRLAHVFSPPALWILLYQIPAFAADVNLRVIVGSVMLATMVVLIAVEFWRGRAEPLMSRWPTIVVLVVYVLVLLARVPGALLAPFADNAAVVQGAPFALMVFGALLFTVVMAFLLLNMTKERTELKHKIDAMIDPLSGVSNRRAFLDGAARLLQQQAVGKEPLAMLLFDLDRFKQINDHFGHALGDRVLRVFTRTATTTLGANVLFGRIGGEEFAALFPVGDVGEGFAVADRVRRNFAAAAQALGDGELRPTVSVGLTLCRPFETAIDEILVRADRGLYRAKEQGRNRVAADDKAWGEPSIVPFGAGERVTAAA